MIEKPEADELVEKGYIRVWAAFEVLASREDVSKVSLENHIKKLEDDERVKMYKKQFSDIKRVDKPFKNLSVGYSYICETEFVVKNFEDLVKLVVEYGPSSIEILEPIRIDMNLTQAQNVLNFISTMMHKFAAAGIGGILIAGRK